MKAKKHALLLALLVSILVSPCALAKDEPSIVEQIDELAKIDRLVHLEARIAHNQAKREKAIAEIEKARAKRAWAKVEQLKAAKKLKELQSGKDTEKKSESSTEK